MIYKKLKKDILSGAVGVTNPVPPLPTNLVYTDRDNTLTAINTFTQPLIVPNATNDNEAINKGQLTTTLSDYTQTTEFNQTIQDLQNTINDLQAKVQALENYKAVIDPLIVEFRDIFKAKVNDLEGWRQTAEPLINDYQTNGAKLNRENTFTARNRFNDTVSIWTNNAALKLVQDNNATYIAIEKADGTRRAHFGIGSSGTHIMNVWGKDGISLQTTANDIQLQPARQIDVSNKKIINLADPVAATDAVNVRSK